MFGELLLPVIDNLVDQAECDADRVLLVRDDDAGEVARVGNNIDVEGVGLFADGLTLTSLRLAVEVIN